MTQTVAKIRLKSYDVFSMEVNYLTNNRHYHVNMSLKAQNMKLIS